MAASRAPGLDADQPRRGIAAIEKPRWRRPRASWLVLPEREHDQPEDHDRDDRGEKRRHGGAGARPAEPVGRPYRGRRRAQARSGMWHGLCLLAWHDRRLERPSAANPSSVWPPRPSTIPATVVLFGSP